ncbi:MAG: hypothetical protein MUF31_15065 [Akkermansiaceae bacterium]|nr:hypothetical protein [Akkermansiaceae bacterium]
MRAGPAKPDQGNGVGAANPKESPPAVISSRGVEWHDSPTHRPSNRNNDVLPAGAQLDYDHESFTHVPQWLPRPTDVAAARAIDASLRSDGWVEGTLEFTLGENAGECMSGIISHLEVSGLHRAESENVYLSANGQHRCEMVFTQAPAPGSVIQLRYQGTDHERGCHCPTCANHFQTPEP